MKLLPLDLVLLDLAVTDIVAAEIHRTSDPPIPKKTSQRI